IIPAEVTDYIKSLSSETRKLEDELRDCDELLQYSPRQPHVSSAVVLFDDLKDIEDAANLAGLSVEEFQRKVLDDLKENDFNEDEVDKEYEEFLQLQREFAELRVDIPKEKPKILAIEDTLSSSSDKEQTLALAPASVTEDGETAVVDGAATNVVTEETTALVKYDEDQEVLGDEEGTDHVAVHSEALTSMRDFILEQLRRNEEFYKQKRQHLVKSIEKLHHEEEREMLRTEERRKRMEDKLKEEQEILRQRREEGEARLEEELRACQEQTSQELGQHQLEIDRLSEALKEERHQFE
ncbi:hypothetical protein EGW08_006083, partial [Elysia chlorotica]